MTVRCASFVGTLAMVVLGFAAPGRAQPSSGDFQVGLMTSLLSHSSTSLEVDQAGASVDVDGSETNWGIHENVLLELGYALNSNVVLGAAMRLGGSSSSTELDEPGSDELSSSEFALFIGPKIDFMFTEGALRPFVGAAAGVTSESSNDVSDTETSATGFEGLGRLGLRWFATRGFSMDLSLVGSFSVVSGSIETASGLDADVSGMAFSAGLFVGASGWI